MKDSKSFDAVEMMRKSREEISQETKDMDSEELTQYINGKLDPAYRSLFEKKPIPVQ